MNTDVVVGTEAWLNVEAGVLSLVSQLEGRLLLFFFFFFLDLNSTAVSLCLEL